MSYPLDLQQVARDVHAWARAQGFYDREYVAVRDPVLGDVEGRVLNPSLPAEKLMLIVTEVAEVQEALRDGDAKGEAEECADILIRLLDYCAWRGVDLEREMHAKIAKNRQRPRLHGRAVS
jgi:NTP pyrophosphatase (non-canonical NTP hydrolase)